MTVLRFYGRRFFAAWVHSDHVRTILYDGSEVRGVPPKGEGFAQSARNLGYGEDVYWHIVEHDLCHAFLAEWLDDAPSAALWAQAHDQDAWQKPPAPGAERDEDRVGRFQGALNGQDWALALLNDRERQALPLLAEVLRPRSVAMTSAWAASAHPAIILPVVEAA